MDLRSERNIFILGFGLYCGLSGEPWVPSPWARTPACCQPATISGLVKEGLQPLLLVLLEAGYPGSTGASGQTG